MIAPDSASYPILGAAQAAGVDYGVALRLVGTYDDCRIGQADEWDVMQVWQRGAAAHGVEAMHALSERLNAAVADGRIRLHPVWRP